MLRIDDIHASRRDFAKALVMYIKLWYNIEKAWRITIMTPKEQCEILLDKILPFAEKQMKKYREFYPFAAVLLTDDSV